MALNKNKRGGKMNKKNTETKKAGLALKLIAMSLLPVIILGVCLTVYTLNILQKSMQSEIQDGLKSTATALAGSYVAIPGDFTTNENGEVVKGDTVITGDYTLVDYIKEQSAVEATLFYQDTRTVTSLKTGSERNVGTKAADTVVEEVLTKGNDYFDTELEIAGEMYYAYYVPIKSSDGSIVGMAFTGKPQAEVNQLIQSSCVKVIGVTVVIVAVAMVVAIFMAMAIIKALKHAMEVLRKVSTGDLTGVIDTRLSTRKDEIGEIIERVNELKDSLKNVISNIQESSTTMSESANSLDAVAAQTSGITEGIGGAINEIV